MTSNVPTPGPGWYPNPSGGPGQRYWDGKNWVEGPTKPKSSKGKWIAGAAAVLFLLIVIGSVGNDEDNKTTVERATAMTTATAKPPSSAAMPVKPAGEVVAPAGSTVRDGKFEFQVLGVERSATKEGIFNPEQAKGEFFIVHLRVTNIGDDARSFSASSQHLIINGNKYDASSSISDEHWMEDINPGLGIEASVTFDIPPGAAPEAIECHDSMFSGGARLAV